MAICGYRTGVLVDATRPNWQDNGPRPVAWSAWYPTEDAGDFVHPSGQFFDLGDVIWNAALPAKVKLPVVMLSHGTGGTAESLGWLARALAGQGYVVIGANHHGNTGVEDHHAAGFLCWWERATDLSVLLTSLGVSGFFAGQLDFDRVSAVGFSLGGHSVLALAGAQTSMVEFEAWHSANAITTRGPKEFPDVADQIPVLAETSDAFQQSWARQGDDFTDSRIASVVAIAPAPPVRAFIPQSVARIKRPVTLLTGGADIEAPTAQCADWLMAQNAGFEHYDLGEHVGHYTFLEIPADRNLVGRVDIFSDHADVERATVHETAANSVMNAVT